MDVGVAVRAAAVALGLLVVPAAAVRLLAGSPAPDAVYSLYFLLFLVAFAVGGGVAAVRAPVQPLASAALAGAIAFGLLAVLGLVLLAGDVGVSGVLFLVVFAGIAVSLAMIGGAVAVWRRRARHEGGSVES